MRWICRALAAAHCRRCLACWATTMQATALSQLILVVHVVTNDSYDGAIDDGGDDDGDVSDGDN